MKMNNDGSVIITTDEIKTIKRCELKGFGLFMIDFANTQLYTESGEFKSGFQAAIDLLFNYLNREDDDE